ncbi:energy transducer TonB [Aquabacterium sp.]|uniref:energy transducer TonB n=1 Tax=Aquabacterium sp. TaxID=1872578 RepID=UPI003D6CF21A
MHSYQLQTDPKRQLFGIGSVVLFHVVVIYALMSGLAQKVVDVVRAPIETKIIEEVKPPPPPKIETPPPPKVDLPPPPFVPPPEVTIAEPPPAPVIAATPTPPPAPVEIAPVAPPVVAPPAPPKPAVVSVSVACPQRAQPVMPAKAERDGITGSVQARLTVKGGKVVNVDIVKSTPRGVFDDAVRKAVLQYGCQDNGDQVVVALQTFEFAAAN